MGKSKHNAAGHVSLGFGQLTQLRLNSFALRLNASRLAQWGSRVLALSRVRAYAIDPCTPCQGAQDETLNISIDTFSPLVRSPLTHSPDLLVRFSPREN